MIGHSLDQIQQADEEGIPADVVAILLVITVLNHRYSADRNIGDFIIAQAHVFLLKTIQPVVQDDLSQKL